MGFTARPPAYYCFYLRDRKQEIDLESPKWSVNLFLKAAFGDTMCIKMFGLQLQGKKLSCKREMENEKDRYVVVVTQRSTMVGHVPRKISGACWLFLLQRGSIDCVIIGAWCNSSDLPKGGLEK